MTAIIVLVVLVLMFTGLLTWAVEKDHRGVALFSGLLLMTTLFGLLGILGVR